MVTFRHAYLPQVHGERIVVHQEHVDVRIVVETAYSAVVSLTFEARQVLEWDGCRRAVFRVVVVMDRWMLVVELQDHPLSDH